jgi:1-aminocyclopropane-1-carboxylate deaminase
LDGRARAVGIAVLKNAGYLAGEIASLLSQAGCPPARGVELLTDHHGGGYAKATPELLQFCRDLEAETGLPLEPVYTGKLFFALRQLAQQGYFRPGERVVALHTGGLQGARGFA